MSATITRPRTDAKGRTVTLFGVPYAGGNMWAYRPLEAALPAGVTLAGLELPGRGRRSAEPLATSLEALADDVFGQIRARAAGRYALFGHSMGALVGLLAARRLAQAALPLPEVFFVSGCEAPSAQTRRRRHELPPQEFVEVLREIGGCPPDVLADRELLEFFEPILRADFQAVETWIPVSGPPIDVPLVVLRGAADEASEGAARAWARESTRPCRVVEFDGGHFFILQHWPAVGSIIQEHLESDARA